MEEFNPSELQEENDCTLKSMYLEYKETFSVVWPKKKKKKICYARVSSDHQKEDLERQVEFLDRLYSGTAKISEVDLISKEKSLPL
jgi:predicted site-specific integrase-resolvase